MTLLRFTLRTVGHYWRLNVMVATSVALVTAALAGSLLVGDSMRGSLRDVTAAHLGATDYAVESPRFFREALAEDLRVDSAFRERFSDACPIIAVEGLATADGHSMFVALYGVDARFWRFHRTSDVTIREGEALVSPALSRDLGARQGDPVALTVRVASPIPLDAIRGPYADSARVFTATVRDVLPTDRMGEFLLHLQQRDVRAIFLPLPDVARALGVVGRVNTVLVAQALPGDDAGGHLERLVGAHVAPGDLGFVLRPLGTRHAFTLESDEGRLTAEQERTARAALSGTALEARPRPSPAGGLAAFEIDALAGHGVDETLAAYEQRLVSKADPVAFGVAVIPVRANAAEASVGNTQFGVFALGVSACLALAAVLLTSLLFGIGVDARARELATLCVVGLDPARLVRTLAAEAVVVAAVGGMAGIIVAQLYASAILAGLRTWWFEMAGMSAVRLHLSPSSIAPGVLAGMVAAIGGMSWTLRGLAAIPERRLLAGGRNRRPLVDPREPHGTLAGVAQVGYGWGALLRLVLRNVARRPLRSASLMAMIATATFVFVWLDASRRGATGESGPRAGAGGFTLIAESPLASAHDPNTPTGRAALHLALPDGVSIEPVLVAPGDDASRLSLYRPASPRVLGVRDALIAEGRFPFEESLAATDAERANPWLLLRRAEGDRVVPVIADADSLANVLHRALGEDIVIRRRGRPVRLRVVGALHDSIFRSELVMSESNFRTLYPEVSGACLWFVEAPDVQVSAVTRILQSGLTGAEVAGTADRLEAFHRVQRAYVAVFQVLGGFGLAVAMVGLALLLFRDAHARRRELVALRAVGYRRHLPLLLMGESVALIAGGSVAGVTVALIVFGPGLDEPGARHRLLVGAASLIAVGLVTGVVLTWIAASAAVRRFAASED